MSDSNQELDVMQIKVAFLEDTVTKLSDEFYQQQRELEKLKSQYAAMVEKLRTQENNDNNAAEVLDERPPHY